MDHSFEERLKGSQGMTLFNLGPGAESTMGVGQGDLVAT